MHLSLIDRNPRSRQDVEVLLEHGRNRAFIVRGTVQAFPAGQEDRQARDGQGQAQKRVHRGELRPEPLADIRPQPQRTQADAHGPEGGDPGGRDQLRHRQAASGRSEGRTEQLHQGNRRRYQARQGCDVGQRGGRRPVPPGAAARRRAIPVPDGPVKAGTDAAER